MHFFFPVAAMYEDAFAQCAWSVCHVPVACGASVALVPVHPQLEQAMTRATAVTRGCWQKYAINLQSRGHQ